ncbi:MAG: ABC transporter ATP-binding protein [Rhodococcus sp.]|uniref:ABC transporter ATP-binding protein n=1 Tax=Rhodococcus TaxID=1827 RepID=UPI0016A26C7B|nr:ABC transporter ATP-binding protein [Rhodococcus sp. (in: high G+C Gram-positive bacteria)]NLV80914.1 ABC transporter ATP-binding protein [Rhodococcus sp. (in: high G+C Gram-positive bacteria)]
MTSTSVFVPACSAREVVRVYGSGAAEVRALSGVSVAFERGRFTAIMGPSGSGKSTLMHVLAGLDRVDGGSVVLHGDSGRADVEVGAASDDVLTALRRDRIGFVFQAFNLLPVLTARDNMLLPLRLAGTEPAEGWFAEVVGRLGLTDRLDHRPHEMSGGQQQRVAVARALLPQPDVIFADEPTGNLDSHAGAEVLALLRSSVREMGQTVVMVTHDPVAASYSDRVVLLADGRLAGEIPHPTADTVLDAMRELGAPVVTR